MCQQCFSRSAAILTAILTSQPVPPPTPEEAASHSDWSAETVEHLRQAMDSVQEFVQTNTKNDRLDQLVAGLTVEQLHSFGTLLTAFTRHLNTLSHLTVVELGTRAISGDGQALNLLAQMEALSRRTDDSAVADLIKEIETKPGQKPGAHLN